MILGRNLIVSIDGVPVAGSKSCQFQISQNFIQACAPTEGRTKRKIPTDYDWSMSVDCLIPNSTLSVSLVDKLIAGTRVLLTFTDGSGQNRAGFAYVKSCDEGGSVGSLATFNVSFESDGTLYYYSRYKTSYFEEGEECQIAYSNGTISYRFDIQRAQLKGVSNAPIKVGTYYVINNGDWVVLKDSFSNVKGYLNNENTTDLSNKQFACGSGYGFVIPDSTATYTFLSNSLAIILFLYEV